MGKKEGKIVNQIANKIYGRKINLRDRAIFLNKWRDYTCLYAKGSMYLDVNKIDRTDIKNILASQCSSIEHQILALRETTQLTAQEYKQRFLFTKQLLTCLYRHHNIFYEGVLFGSTVNGLGFRDSDVDLRLRPLMPVGQNVYEPISMDDDMVERTLRDIAFQTTKCCPALGDFVPSTRCPVAKLNFYKEKGSASQNERGRNNNIDPSNLQEGLKFDVSLSSSNPLGTYNSIFLRFLCYLEPKFHLLATVLRYWSNVHDLIVPGYLSSYALINMLIFFCQTIEPPLLPTLDYMRDLYFKYSSVGRDQDTSGSCKKGLTQVEWHCVVCLRKEFYAPSTNTEPLSVLLLKFFELYLNFPYSTHMVTTRPGRAITHEEFKSSSQFHPRFPIKDFINIQDPFDLKHNLTSGMNGGHFQLLMITMRHSYERLFKELLNNFQSPSFPVSNPCDQSIRRLKQLNGKKDARDWGLNALFVKLTDQELKNA